jgi:hypothetical protein
MTLIYLYILPVYIYLSATGILPRFLHGGKHSILLVIFLFIFLFIKYDKKFPYNLENTIGFILLYFLIIYSLICFLNNDIENASINVKFVILSLFSFMIGITLNLKYNLYILFLNSLIVTFILLNYNFTQMRLDFENSIYLNTYQAYLEISHCLVVLGLINISILNKNSNLLERIILISSYLLLITCAGSRQDYILGGLILLISLQRNHRLFSLELIIFLFFIVIIFLNPEFSSTRFYSLFNILDDHSLVGRIEVFNTTSEIILNNIFFGTHGKSLGGLFMHNILFYLQLYGILFFVPLLFFIYLIYYKIIKLKSKFKATNNSNFLLLSNLSIYFGLDALLFSGSTLHNFFLLAGILSNFDKSSSQHSI